MHWHGSRQHIHFLTDLSVRLIAAEDTPQGFAAAWRWRFPFRWCGEWVLRTPTPAKGKAADVGL